MAVAAVDTVFSIPFRFLWSTNFAGDLESMHEPPTGLARFVGDEKNQLLKILASLQSSFLTGGQNHLWPMVLFGPSGTGKTSLALTIISELADEDQQSANPGLDPLTAKARRPNSKPIVLTAVDFDRRFRSALATDSVPDFRRRLLRSNGLVIDDLQQLIDKPAAQLELLFVVDQLLARHCPLVVTMDRDPQQSEKIMPQLISRFCMGLSLPVHEPGPSARAAIIADLSQIHGLRLSGEAMELLVSKLNISVPKIVHFFGQLKTAYRLQTDLNDDSTLSGVIDPAFLQRMFHRSDEDQLKLAMIIVNQVAAEYKLKPKDLRSDSRKQSTVHARAVAIYLNRKLLGLSFLKIGSLFGHRDHSTIMHANRKIESLLAESAGIQDVGQIATATRNLIEKLEQQLTNLFAIQLTFV